MDKIAGMTPELADKLTAFLNEMTEEGGEEEEAGSEADPGAGTVGGGASAQPA